MRQAPPLGASCPARISLLNPLSALHENRDFPIEIYYLAIGNGDASKMVGKNLLDMRDADGVDLIKNFIEIANTTGKGWSDYKWPNPVNAVIENALISCGMYK